MVGPRSHPPCLLQQLPCSQLVPPETTGKPAHEVSRAEIQQQVQLLTIIVTPIQGFRRSFLQKLGSRLWRTKEESEPKADSQVVEPQREDFATCIQKWIPPRKGETTLHFKLSFDIANNATLVHGNAAFQRHHYRRKIEPLFRQAAPLPLQ